MRIPGWHPLLVLGVQLVVFIWLGCWFQIAKQTYTSHSNETHHIHRTLYVDRRFSLDQVEAIQRAAQRWTQATNHIAEIEVVVMPEVIKDADHLQSVIVLDANPDMPGVITLDATNHATTAAYYSQGEMVYPIIAVVDERITTIYTFEKVMMHEIGHSLKMEHLTGENGEFTLMYPDTLLMSEKITEKDMAMFCGIYDCDPRKLIGE